MAQIVFENIVNQQGIVQADYSDTIHDGTIRFEMADPIKVRSDLVAEALAALCGNYYDIIHMHVKVSDNTKHTIEQRTGSQLTCEKGLGLWNLNKLFDHKVKTLNLNSDFSNFSAAALTPGPINKVTLDCGRTTPEQYVLYDHVDSKLIKTNVLDTHFPKITSDYRIIGSILYKDYFNTAYMMSGLQLNPKTMNMTKTEAEHPIAGMKNLPHTLGLTAVGHTRIACQSYPDYMNDAIQAVKTSDSFMATLQHTLVEIQNERFRLGLPLKDRTLYPDQKQWGEDSRVDFYTLYILKHGGRRLAEYLVSHIPTSATKLVQRYDLQFFDRFYPGVLYYLPDEIREYVLKQLKLHQISLFSNEDWQAFKIVQKWLRTHRTPD